MEMDIVRGTITYLEECSEALLQSDLASVYFPEEDKVKQMLQRGFEQGEIDIAVDESQECLGFIWYDLHSAFRFPYVRLIAVRPEHRGKGVGRFLLNHFEKTASSKRLFLLVSDFNTRAKSLYTEMGYKEVGILPDFIRDGVAECIMVKYV
jgi:ribosomal protein S18 acetylase RimI-like enzyme